MNKIIQIQENALLSFSRNAQPGRPVGIYLYFSGTNAATKTADLSALGTLTVKRGGRTVVNRTIKSLANYADVRFGSNYFSSTVAAVFAATVFIPFYEEGLLQSLDIQGDSELVISYEPKQAGLAEFADLNVTAYTSEGYQTEPERYEFYILGDDQAITGAVTKPYQLNNDNITAIYLEDPSTVVANVGYKNNNGQIFSSQPWNVLLGSTLIENRLESSTFDMIELQMFSKGEATSYTNKRNSIEIETSGAGTVNITKTFLIPNERFMDWI